MDPIERVEMILRRFTEEDLKNIKELLTVYKMIEKETATKEGYKKYNAKRKYTQFRERMIEEGRTGADLEAICYNEMRYLGLITLDELKIKLRELDGESTI
jgi:polynucleotide 5'-kinase involved in rRNA processing